MDRTVKWFAAILLPLFASCSTTVGIVKKTPDLKSTSQQKVDIAKKNSPFAAPQKEGAFHIVSAGENLRQICDVYGLDLAKVAKINRILPPYALKKGDEVFLPSEALLADGEKDLRWEKSATASSAARKHNFKLSAPIRGKRDPVVPELKFPVLGGVLTSPFGYRWGRFHKGLDIAAPIGHPVLACADGRVIFTGSRKRFRRYGNTVLIDHGRGVYTYYAHLSAIKVKKNQRVRRGQKIALVGNTGRSTGPHLHLEVRVINKVYNPLAYFSPNELSGILIAKRFSDSPMGPVRAHWRVPDLLTARR
ncbi:MAG: peptidoglycan DD-metalloendopeptidase family protein [Desulfomonilaceae bacterium]